MESAARRFAWVARLHIEPKFVGSIPGADSLNLTIESVDSPLREKSDADSWFSIGDCGESECLALESPCMPFPSPVSLEA